MPVVGLGMDICSIDRIQRILDGPRAEKFLERVYTEAERALCSSRQDAAAAFAARFAAKEALLKALGAPSGVRWREIEVVPTSSASATPVRRSSGAPLVATTSISRHRIPLGAPRALSSASLAAKRAAKAAAASCLDEQSARSASV